MTKLHVSGTLVHQILQILPSADRRYNPFEDSDSSNLARHEYFQSRRSSGTCDWFIYCNEFWLEWLFGDDLHKTLFCWGPPGVGKSTIT